MPNVNGIAATETPMNATAKQSRLEMGVHAPLDSLMTSHKPCIIAIGNKSTITRAK